MDFRKVKRHQYPEVWEWWKRGDSPHAMAGRLGVTYSVIRDVLQRLIDTPELRHTVSPEDSEQVSKVSKRMPELWERDPTIGDAIKRPEILEKYR